MTNASTTKASLAPLDPQQVACGRIVYETFCVQCHGQRGEGQPNWQLQNPDDTYPPPPHDSSGHTWHHGDSYLYRIVREGGKFNETPGFKSAMPAWGSILSLEEISAVITYLKSLWGSREREYQAQATLQELRH
ncbi:MAG: cytochrome c [Chloroflexi bacterium]|nr:cytochrome c [Chloroflexota bacterium]